MKIFAKSAAAVLALAGLALAGTAYAITPSLYFSNLSGSLVSITVTGDHNATVILFYNTPSGLQNRVLGMTDVNGNLYTTADTNILGVNSGSSAYVLVNGQQSVSVNWPQGGLTFGQSNVTLTSGQTMNVSVSGGGGSYYISGNTNPGAVGATVSGSSVILTALSGSGSATVTVCSSGGSFCGTLTVTITGGGGSGIYFSPSANPTILSPGGTQTITVYGGGGYYLSGNTNPGIVSAYLSGNNLVISSAGGAYGSSVITVCSSGGGCGSLTVTVSGTGGGLLTFSPANPVVSYSQSVSVNVFGGSGGYYVSANSNPASVSTSLTGSVLMLSGVSNGAATITVCSSSGGCGSLNVTVTPYNTGGGTVTFSQNSEFMSPGQTLSVSLSGSSGSYYLSSGNGGAVQASISGNILYLTAVSAGSANLSVCSSGTGCGTLAVTVGGGAVDASSLLAELQSLQNQLAALQGGQTVYSGTTTATSGGFVSFMSPGGSGSEVAALQRTLARLGIFYGPVTGYYGPLTTAAVQRYQSMHGLNPTGTTGPATRAALNLEY